jgi:hypothetical protein
MADRFRILVQERRDSTCDPPREAPDRDPDDLDLPLWRFCYDQNRRVLLQVGTEELEAELDPDFRVILTYLPAMVSRLCAGETEVLSFSERWYEVKLVPQDDTIQCTVRRWGYEVSERSLLCERAQVLGELQRFLHEIADLTVAEGYLSPAQRQELLGPEAGTTA